MSTYTLRTAIDGDAAVIARLVGSLLSELYPGMYTEDQIMEGTTHALGKPADVEVILAFRGADPVGVLTLNRCTAIYALGDFGEISELYVDPAHRSAGVGSILIDRAKDIVRQKRWSMLEVGAPDFPRWARTKQFYLKEGFEEIGPRLYWTAN